VDECKALVQVDGARVSGLAPAEATIARTLQQVAPNRFFSPRHRIPLNSSAWSVSRKQSLG